MASTDRDSPKRRSLARNKSGASHVAGATGGGVSTSGGHGHARTKSSRTLTRGANGGSAFRLGTLTATNSVARLIDLFLADAKAMGDRVPSDDELARARHFLKHLEASTREDHLKSVDEVLSHAPRELLLKTKQLQEAEQFVLLAAADDVQKLQRKLDNDWELVNATDVRVIELLEVYAVESACLPRRWLLSAQRDGHTALHAAAACNCLAAVELLIKRGAHVTLQDVRMLALRCGFGLHVGVSHCTWFLCQYEGYLPLHWAAENDALEVAELLALHTDDMEARTAVRMARCSRQWSRPHSVLCYLIRLACRWRICLHASFPIGGKTGRRSWTPRRHKKKPWPRLRPPRNGYLQVCRHAVVAVEAGTSVGHIRKLGHDVKRMSRCC